MYITTSGATEIDLTFDDATALGPILFIAVNGSVDIDWGDGTEHATKTGSSLTTLVFHGHKYAAIGSYTIKITVTSGSMAFRGESLIDGIFRCHAVTEARSKNYLYSRTITAIRLGNNTDIGPYAF